MILDINKIKENPDNPRTITEDKFKKLVKSLKELDEVALVFDPWMYGFDTRNESFFPNIPYNNFPSNCNVTRINHHYAHHLSCWPLVKNPKKYRGICIDGFGDYDNASRISHKEWIYRCRNEFIK